jgi:hypothetical protein
MYSARQFGHVQSVKLTLCSHKRIGAEVGDTAASVDEEGAIRTTLLDHHGRTTGLSRLLGQVKVGKHNVAALMEENVYRR